MIVVDPFGIISGDIGRVLLIGPVAPCGPTAPSVTRKTVLFDAVAFCFFTPASITHKMYVPGFNTFCPVGELLQAAYRCC